MRLRHVDKPQYRKMTNQVQVGLIAILAISSVVFGQILIALLGSASVEAGQPTGNFYFTFLWNNVEIEYFTFLINSNMTLF